MINNTKKQVLTTILRTFANREPLDVCKMLNDKEPTDLEIVATNIISAMYLVDDEVFPIDEVDVSNVLTILADYIDPNIS